MAKIILFDVDGVLADFVYGFTALTGQAYTTGEQKEWDMLDRLTPHQLESAWQKVNVSDTFWLSLPPLVSKETFYRINLLSKEHTIIFGTHRMGIKPQTQTNLWLVENGITNPNVVVTKRKGEFARVIDADFSIDDKVENANCIHWIADSKPCKSFLLDRHYNRIGKTKGVTRIESVEKFLGEIDEA